MDLVIKDVSGTTLHEFPATFYLKGKSFKIRTKSSGIPYRDGGLETGDRKQEERFLTLYGKMYNQTNALLQTDVDSLKADLYDEDSKRLHVDDRFINIGSLVDFTEDYIPGADMVLANISIVLKASDPNYYGTEVINYDALTGASLTQFTETQNGNKLAFPIIGASATAITYFLCRNTTTGQCFVIEFPIPGATAAVGASMINVDCRNGKVWINGTTDGQTYMTGNFIRYNSGTNVLNVYGDGVGITVSFAHHPTYV